MTVQIDTTAVNNGVRLAQQTAHPSSPASGYEILYIISGSPHGGMFLKDSSGRQIGPFITGSSSSGGITQSYVGYNTIGGSTENVTSRRVYTKMITLATAAMVNSIDVYVDAGAAGDQVRDLSVAIYSNLTGTPNLIIAANINPSLSLLLDNISGGGGNTNPRWLAIPIGAYLPSGDYWISVASFATNAAAALRFYFDATGNDRYYGSGGDWFADWGFYSQTVTANKYSIRASIIT